MQRNADDIAKALQNDNKSITAGFVFHFLPIFVTCYIFLWIQNRCLS
jgi:hypothetical protein